MNTAQKGRRAERKVIGILRAAGYTVIRGAASKCYGAPVDVIAWNAQGWRLVNIKTNGYVSALEREALELLPVPPQTSVEIWRIPDRCREPLIEILRS